MNSVCAKHFHMHKPHSYPMGENQVLYQSIDLSGTRISYSWYWFVWATCCVWSNYVMYHKIIYSVVVIFPQGELDTSF